MDTTTATETGPAKAVSDFSEQLAQTAQSQRALVTEITSFAKDETKRFFNLRMDRTSQALEKLQSCQGLSGLIGVQQEWLRDLMQDYAELGQRNAAHIRGISQTVVAQASTAASETVDRMHAHAQDSLQQGAQMMAEANDRIDHAVQNAGEQATTFTQDANANWQH